MNLIALFTFCLFLLFVLAGKGMGYAKAAELNGYSGLKHVLELAVELHLSPGQREQAQAVFSRMEASARELGSRLVDAERELDSMFREGTVTADSLAETLSQIGALQAQLRGAHLQAHLEQVRILTNQQVARYRDLRGYGDGGHADHSLHHGGR